MNVRTLRAAINKAKKVFVWVVLFDTDGEYVEVSKTAVLRALKGTAQLDGASDIDWKAQDLYIN